MPRQPYLPTFGHLNYSVGALVLKDRPDLCSAIGKCVAIWGHVDNEMGDLFGLLLGTESAGTLEIFLTLRRFSYQRDVLTTAAKHRLSGEALETAEAIVRAYGFLEAERNSLAHGCFGVSDDDRTILYWLDVKDHVEFQTTILSAESRGERVNDRHALLKRKMFVYRLSDLEALYCQMEEFWHAVFYFNGYMRNPTDPNRITEYQRLREFAQISRALAELAH